MSICVARMERSEIRETKPPDYGATRLHPGYTVWIPAFAGMTALKYRQLWKVVNPYRQHTRLRPLFFAA